MGHFCRVIRGKEDKRCEEMAGMWNKMMDNHGEESKRDRIRGKIREPVINARTK